MTLDMHMSGSKLAVLGEVEAASSGWGWPSREESVLRCGQGQCAASLRLLLDWGFPLSTC